MESVALYMYTKYCQTYLSSKCKLIRTSEGSRGREVENKSLTKMYFNDKKKMLSPIFLFSLSVHFSNKRLNVEREPA